MKKARTKFLVLLLLLVLPWLSNAFTVAPIVTHQDPQLSLSGTISLSIASGTAPYTLYAFGDTIVFTTDTVAVFNGLNAGAYHVNVTDNTGDSVVLDVDVLFGIAWRNSVNVSTTLHTVDKTSGGSAWNAGAYSYNSLPANTDGYLLVVPPTAGALLLVGLSKFDYNSDNSSVKYGFYHNNGTMRPMINGIAVGTASSYTGGDVFKMAREGNDIKFYKNTTLLYTHATTGDEQLFIDYHVNNDGTSAQVPKLTASFGSPLASEPTITHHTPVSDTAGSINPGIIGGAAPYSYLWSNSATTATLTGLGVGTYGLTVTDANSVSFATSYNVEYGIVWRNEANVTTTASSVTKIGGGTAYNAGASSKNMIPAGEDGIVHFETHNALYYGAFGLSMKDYNTNPATMAYRIHFHNSGISVRIGDVIKGTYGTSAPGDVYSIGRVGDTISFWKNGIVLYNYPSGNTEELVVDATLFYEGNSLLDMAASFDVPFRPYPAVTHNLPNNHASGSITLNPEGGTTPYTYAWTDGGSSATRTGLAAGNYTVTVTDAASATVSENIRVGYQIEWKDTFGVEVTPHTIMEVSALTYQSGASSKNRLLPYQNGLVEYEIPDGTNWFVFGWAKKDYSTDDEEIRYGFYVRPSSVRAVVNGNETGPNPLLKAGDVLRLERYGDSIYFKQNGNLLHKLAVDPSEGLVMDFSIITENQKIYAVPSFGVPFGAYPVVIHNDPFDLSSGSITLAADGGTPPYTYAWADGGNSSARTGLTAANYTVTVTDAASSTVAQSIPIGHKIAWADSVNIYTTDSSLVPTGGSTGIYTAGASSQNRLAAGQDGYLQFEWVSINEGYISAGFSKKDYSFMNGSMLYGININGTTVRAYHNGAAVGSSRTMIVGDYYTVERLGDSMRYKLNGVVFHTHWVDSNEELILDVNTDQIRGSRYLLSFGVPLGGYPIVTDDDTVSGGTGALSMRTAGGTAPYAYQWNDGSTSGSRTGLNAGAHSVTITDANGATVAETHTVGYKIYWQNVTGATTTSGSVAKTGTSNGWNEGASSVNKLKPYANGHVEYEVSARGLYAAGLSETDANTNITSMKYGLVVNANNAIQIYENSSQVTGSFGTAYLGDRLKVSRAGSEIRYFRNGTLLRTVSTDPSLQLIADISLYSTGLPPLPLKVSFGDPLTVSGSVTGVSAGSPSGGSIDVTLSGGFAPFTYTWSNSTITQDLANLSIGEYSVTVTDYFGNTATKSFNVINDQELYWTGAADDDWHNGQNWSWLPCGSSADTIPDSTMAVIFTACDSVQARLTTDATVKRLVYAAETPYLTDENGFSLTILEGIALDGMELSLSGNLNISHDVEILSGTIELNGYELTVNGEFSVSGGEIVIGSGHLVTISDLTLSGGILDCGTGELEVQGDCILRGGSLDGGSSVLAIDGNLDIAFGNFVSTLSTLVLGGDLEDPYGFFQHASGNVAIASSGTINTKAPLYDLTVNTGFTAVLAQPLTISHMLELDGSLSLSAYALVLGWSSASAIQDDGGKIIAEGDAFAGKVIWAVGTSTSTYSIPFTNAHGEDLAVEVDITSAGSGTGSLVFSLYPTDTDIEPLPAGMPELYGPDDTPNYGQIMQRFWLVDFTGYSSKPVADVDIKYVDRDLNGITDPADLKAQQWMGYGWGNQVGTVNTTNRKVSLSSFSGGIFVLNTLDDILYPYRHDDYATLKRKLDGSYYIAIDGLNVKYEEAYNTGNLDYAVYNQQHDLIFGSSLGHNITKAYGDNRFFIRCHCHTGIFTDGQFYVLEVTNEKGEKFMLRFQYKYTRPCIQVGLQNQGAILD